MTPCLGTLERHPDGVLSGVFRTLLIHVQIDLRPLPPVDGVRTFDVIAAPDFLFGVGRQDAASVESPIELRLRAPELSQELKAQAVCEGDDRWRIVWRVD